MTDLTPVSSLLTAYNPRFATANYAPVRRWLDDGADMEADILPVLKHWIGKKPNIYSLGFFTPYVRQAREKRLNAPRPLTDHERAKNLAFIIRRVGQRFPTEERWLARFEAENGAVDWR